ncbi:TonB-dependent receptor domain-containing protein [Alteraurantiacibacter aquimixticola]|uniref:TonB-dependent receptor n=1 Tax=Alteraurantiacibacter aquimixticola TaxID=2489173 RepID=A0A4T3F421_9SPHN|nr:TonB-dependent receptor [Alteraurantiacibacter aquimixticola]TIX50258.1 TonB-dependent receptor [Alteraurantiacibacter aquimixticola]
MNMNKQALRRGTAALALAISLGATPSFAQDADAVDSTEDEGVILVTGTRIARPNMEAASPVAVVSGDDAQEFADITLDTFVNTLPQVNPAGTTTSNNPGNGGQSNVNLRGLGANRNLVLIDGRRPMVSANNMTVDLNTIPAALVERIEVITGGAGAVYGADAIAGAVNLVLKDDFEGIDVSASYSNALRDWDAEEYTISGVLGGNFADGRGNAVVAVDYSEREALIKSQRAFSVFATSTTSFLPDGLYFPSGNGPSQAAVDAIFTGYGSAAGSVPANQTLIGFNLDGTLFSRGIFNSPIDVENFTGPVDFSVNQALFPDLYSYNFDEVNLLVLPFKRTSVMSKIDYEFAPEITVFAQGGYTRYTSATALAPTPIPTVGIRAPGENSAIQVSSPLIEAGGSINNLLVIPATNPFIPADFAALLASRTLDNTNLVGTGADEPFLMRQRTLDIGLRQSDYTNQVFQVLGGLRGELTDSWSYELSYSFGRTNIDQEQTGNVDTQRLFDMLNDPNGGADQCEGGFNPFGRQPISDDCVDYLAASGLLRTEFTQKIVQGYVVGDLVELPAGNLTVVLGAENRAFEYELDPGSSAGPISGFNTQTPDAGENSFFDIFGEVAVPIISDQPWARELTLTLGYRASRSEFTDIINEVSSDPRWDDAYKAELIWSPTYDVNVRGSYQRSVRAPNFGELFSGGGSAPQIFDPCSVTTQFRANGGDDARTLCRDAGAPAPFGFGGIGAAVDNFVQTPGTQASVELSGNTDLGPETADTFTFGAAFSNGFGAIPGLTGSIDYYNIKISDTIQSPDPNTLIADCYNYYGNNPNLDASYGTCQQLFRAPDILFIYGPDTGSGLTDQYPGVNGGKLKTSGIDMQLNYAFDPGLLGDDSMNLNLFVNYLIDFKQQVLANQPVLDYAGTASFFGAGLGTSFPEWRANLTMDYDVADFGFQVRARYIDGMENRASVIFPGETEFTGTGSAIYIDTAVDYTLMDHLTLRVGINNLFDKDPEVYAPNVQSGTDPSLYDVIGRRIFFRASLSF